MEGQATWHKTISSEFIHNEKLYCFLGFLIWPFGLTVGAFRQWDSPWSKNVFWLFCIFFGFTFIIADLGWADSGYYADLFVTYAHSDIDLKDLWNSLYRLGSGYDDIASPLISFLLSRITDNPTILFALFGLIFGYFYSRNIWYVLERTKGKATGIVLLYVLTFILLNPIWNINGFRFYVAAQIFLFGVLPYLIEGKKTSLLWAVASVFFHFSFVFALAVLLVFLVLGNRPKVFLGFFIITAFIQEIDLQYVQSSLTFLPDIYFNKVMNYTNVQYVEGLRLAKQSINWYVSFSNSAVRWVIYASVLYIFFFGRQTLKERKDLTTLLSFSLLLFSAANIFSLIPSGGRFIIVASTFMLAFIILFFSDSQNYKGFLFLKVFSLPLLLLFSIVTLRSGMDYFGFMTLVGNPLTVIMYSENIPIIDLIKSLL